MSVNHVIFGTQTLIDLRSDTVAADKVLNGYTAHGADGETITGSMPNRGSVSGTISTVNGSYSIAQGYHNGNGAVSIDSTEAAKLIASNIRAGVSILGVLGTLGLFTQVTPIATDFNNGYVGNINGWIYQANSNNRGNVYQVTAGHTYFCRLVGTGGNRWRGCFTTGNPVTATGNLSGSCVIYHNENTVPEKACFAYKPRVDGYITIVKTNAGVNNIQTIMYDITGFDMLLE